MTDERWHQWVVFVPETHINEVKDALFAAGAGRLGAYTQCSWQVLGQGQFMPMAASTPTVGQHNTLTRVAEYRLEFLCADAHQMAVLNALKSSHPYETPAYYFFPVQFEVEAT